MRGRRSLPLAAYAGFAGCFWDWNQEANVDNLKDLRYDTCPDQKLGDSISSYRNTTRSVVLLAEHPGFKGYHYCIDERASGNVILGFNDKASALGISESLRTQDLECNYVDQD